MSYSRSTGAVPQRFQVVDLFAGPGGLAEGFSAFSAADGTNPFDIVLSVEKERSAHRTLRLRSFLRQFDGDLPPEYYSHLNGGGAEPDWASLYPEEWSAACEEAICAELGSEQGNRVVHERLAELARVKVPKIVIGGPPCQAYSLVGRARNAGKADYIPQEDRRHFLYQEYIGILNKVQPVAFVMENVKGMLSSSIDGENIFARVLEDLRAAGNSADSYQLFAIASDDAGRMTLRSPEKHAEFLLKSECFGVPQTRHRVIVVGLRRDLADSLPDELPTCGLAPEPAVLRHVLADMPRLRSGLSVGDGAENWQNMVLAQMRRARSAMADGSRPQGAELLSLADEMIERFAQVESGLSCASSARSTVANDCPELLREWLVDPLLQATANHATRRHMADDFARYFFCAVFGQVFGRAPKSREFPTGLAPAHANWSTGAFADRFRSQVWDEPSTTITSHISKDGHYFVHPDPTQCRSLTVREAARLQTFPDNYLFLGNRTEQYVQVGNAVPPFLARQIAGVLAEVLSLTGVVKARDPSASSVRARSPMLAADASDRVPG